MKKNLKYFLRSILNEKELSIAPSSFDVVGDIMLFADFPMQLVKKGKKIGDIILENYPNIKAIMRKTKKHSGKFRTPKYKIIAGEKRKETIHKENNVFIQLDVEKVYFSPRMGTERKRISEMVKPNESILTMFSGCAPYPLVIARNSNCKEVYGIEINPTAHKYALANIRKNKLENKIKLFCGDVRRIMPKLNKKFDRILMPLPKGGEDFLELALKYAKKNGFIHFYDFLREDEFNLAVDKIRNACNKSKKKFKIINIAKCGEFAPSVFRVCVDFKVL